MGTSVWSVLCYEYIQSIEFMVNPSPHIGDIVYSRLLGKDYIIVNSEKVARTLSDAQRSAVYADRPTLSIYKL